MKARHGADFAVVGGGIIGLSIARELKTRHADCHVLLLEKEKTCGQHASGRNSGVLHAGFYYTPDSLKARMTRQGNAALSAYCEQKQLRVNRCGKLVVARNADELRVLDELARRAEANGVPLVKITAEEARAIEPRALTFERALFSPTTSSVDPRAVVRAMERDALNAGIEIVTGARFLRRDGRVLVTSMGRYAADYVINAAGLQADAIAREFGFARNHRILPFKGLYLYSDEPVGTLRTHIYPVPDLRNPFLGVHFTVNVEGHIKIGPTAIPAFWREQYSGFSRFRLDEFAAVVALQSRLMLSSSFDFKRLAFDELRKYSRRRLVAKAGELATGVDARHYRRWGPPGIRAQLLDLRTGRLELDFVIEGDRQSMHVLNAVSPAFTCALPFARYVCDAMSRVAQGQWENLAPPVLNPS